MKLELIEDQRIVFETNNATGITSPLEKVQGYRHILVKLDDISPQASAVSFEVIATLDLGETEPEHVVIANCPDTGPNKGKYLFCEIPFGISPRVRVNLTIANQGPSAVVQIWGAKIPY